MRFAFFAITAAIAVVAQPSAPAVLFNPPPSIVEAALAAKYQTSQSNPPAPQPLTNAKRFAAGLPPLNPRSRHRHRAPHGGSKIDTARRSSTSPLPPLSKKCNIQVTDAEGASLGFISPTWNEFGEYSTLQPGQTGSLEVSFSYTVDSTSQRILSTENGPDTALPLFGAIVGYASSDNNLAPGNPNYAYLGGTVSTAPGSPAVSASELGLSSPSNSFTAATGIERDIESAIWTYDPVTDGITAQWINTDGSAPATYISIFNGIFVLTGDVDEFAKVFGVPAEKLFFSCVTPVAIAQPV